MYNILLVDDEIDSLFALQASMDWSALGVDKVLLADGAAKAQELLQRYTIHLLICDIEMPGMDGLQLWSWTKEHYPDTEGIFLTCHADFAYAQRAIELGGRNYLLKPTSPDKLAEEIEKTFAAITERNATRKSSALWKENLAMRRRDYLFNVINRQLSSSGYALQRLSEERQLDFAPGMQIIPVLLLVQQWHREMPPEDIPLMEYGICNTASEIFVKDEQAGDVLRLSPGHILVLLYLPQDGKLRLSLEGACKEQVDTCYRYLTADISCLIGRSCTVDQLAEAVDELNEYARKKAIHHLQVYHLRQTTIEQFELQVPDASDWPSLLQEGSGSIIYDRIATWLQKAEQNGSADVELLQRIQQDFLQAVYGVLQDNNIQANLLFQDKHSFLMQEKSLYSIEHFLSWLQWTVRRASDCMNRLNNADSVVVRVKKYISANIKNEDLNRDAIANAVYLNPDYLSRLFKQQTGCSLTEYIQQQRLTLAKNLLAQTRLSVGDIAFDLGYNSFSYFTRVFKAATGYTPMEYRKNFTK